MREPDPLERSQLAYENPAFLNSADGRIIRILSEYSEPLARFRRQCIQDTVVFFGSARFHSRDAASRELELLANDTAAEPAPADEQPGGAEGGASASELRLHRAEAATEMAQYYEDARRLAFLLTEWTRTLGPPDGASGRHRFVVCSGGGPGIMEAANRGAWEAGGKSIGLNIKLPFEQLPNRYITPELNFDFSYFFMRKFWFAYLAKALVVFPGGFGTLDELFELLTLAQTGKLAKNIPVVIYGSQYWKTVLNIEALIERGAVSSRDRRLFEYADSPEEAFAKLRAGLEQQLAEQSAHGEVDCLAAAELQPEIARTRT